MVSGGEELLAEATGAHERRLSPCVTALAAAVLLGYLGWIGWNQVSVSRLDRVSSPEEALELMVSRSMELEEALARGILWAWAYEKTGSLLPGMVAHAANNLMVSASVLVLLRLP